jgi:hypothetical protein
VSAGDQNPLRLPIDWARNLGVQLHDEIVELLLGTPLSVVGCGLLELDPLKHV